MTITDAIQKHQESSVHIFTEWGVYVGDGWGLKFNKDEYDKHFEHGCYLPSEKKWLMKNALLTYVGGGV
jgi:hypothetical protein